MRMKPSMSISKYELYDYFMDYFVLDYLPSVNKEEGDFDDQMLEGLFKEWFSFFIDEGRIVPVGIDEFIVI